MLHAGMKYRWHVASQHDMSVACRWHAVDMLNGIAARILRADGTEHDTQLKKGGVQLACSTPFSIPLFRSGMPLACCMSLWHAVGMPLSCQWRAACRDCTPFFTGVMPWARCLP
jgi:hypothetical protein